MTARYDNTDGRMRGRRRQQRRMRVWARSPYCAMCGKLVTMDYPDVNAFELDHIVSLHDGGNDTEANCQVLCVTFSSDGLKSGCHIDKTNREMGHKTRVAIGLDGWPT